MPRRLSVIDGGDQGRVYMLPEAGAVLIGSSRKHTDICLHDLYVGRAHCQVTVEGDVVTVIDQETPQGTLVNGTKVTRQELRLGDVIRIGNSYLRLEEGDAPLPEEADEPAGSAPSPTPAKLPHLPAERLSQLTGHGLGHYKIGPVLGQGHYGPVFRSHDAKRDQEVALKVLPTSFPAGTEEMRRFVEALKPILFLQHPGLAVLRGLGKTGPYVWLARELVEGESAAARIERTGTLPKIKWRPTLRLAVQIARALEFMHQKHLVHANITPANILAQADSGPARLADLGLWDALVGSALQQEKLEQKFLAELPYLSPEHIDPDARVDELSDQYSLGAVVYALLTGRSPCLGSTPDKTIARIRETLPARPKDLQKAIPEDFQATVLRHARQAPRGTLPHANPAPGRPGENRRSLRRGVVRVAPIRRAAMLTEVGFR